MKKYAPTILLAAAALSIYAYFCSQLNFTQDDAYISYRYVENYLSGHGLVYNVGERIEGFTNFGWVIYLTFWGALGIGYITVSKITGFLLGASVIILTLLISRRLFDRPNSPFVWLPVFLVALNQSLAYWSPAGLETAAFAAVAMLSLYLYIKRNWFLTASLVGAVLMRPEGALVAFILLVIEAIETRKMPVFSGTCTILALLFTLPYVIFKLSYYGSIFPNPFFAKTGLSVAKLMDGLEYTGRFFQHYGFYGAGLVVPLVFFNKLSRAARAAWIFSIVYIIYIVLVGGDVLKVHRFFLPVLGTSAVLISFSVWLLANKLSLKTRNLVLVLVAIPLLYATYTLPREFVQKYNGLEKQFTAKMSFMADNLAATDSSSFSVALPTIGIFGYRLMGHRIIDMVGLTDSTIARHSEPSIDGMESTWKERKHNSQYLLSLKPDYILFSTDMKPSAPAEKALMLYDQFLRCYRLIGWDQHDPRAPLPIIRMVFKRMREYSGEIVPTHPIEFVDNYKLGMEAYSSGDQRRAIKHYRKAIEVSPQPPYVYALYSIAFSHLLMNDSENGITLMDSVVAQDSLIFLANAVLYKHARVTNQPEKAAAHRRWIEATVPWLWPKLEAETAVLLEDARRRRP